MKISRLHENYIQSARKPLSFGAFPVTPTPAQAPVIPVNRWEKTRDFYKKVFSFRQADQRVAFVKNLLDYELEIGHFATHLVTEDGVVLTLTTQGVGVTELDKEYASYADELYRDVVYSSAHE